MDPHTFERLSPSRFIVFTFPNPLSSSSSSPSSSPVDRHQQPLLRVAVLDSPFLSTCDGDNDNVVAAMLVPVGREDDWIFSTEAGHLQLLLSSTPSPSRLILVGDLPPPQSQSQSQSQSYIASSSATEQQQIQQLKKSILPLLHALSPKSAFNSSSGGGIPFLSYEDDVTRIVPVDRLLGPIAGEMLVEDVELLGQEWRRRLRFKRAPNLVQSQVRLTDASLLPEMASLVQPYLGPMAAALSLLSPSSTRSGRALCLGVGGGDLLMCLRHRFGFNVTGVEADEVVVSAAKRHFGLIEDESLQVVVGDGIMWMASNKDEYDVIMVDLDSDSDSRGMISAPPVEFFDKSSGVVAAARLALGHQGIMVVNVIPFPSPPPCHDRSFYTRLIHNLSQAFAELYEIDVGNGENYVLAATVSRVPPQLVDVDPDRRAEAKGPFFHKLKQVGADRFLHCIKKLLN